MITILTAYDDNFKDIIEINLPILQQYCTKNNYTLIVKKIINFEKPASWFKISAILEEFHKPNCKYVLWLDADTLILQQDFKLEAIIKPDKYFYISQDINGINCGVFMMSNVDIIKQFLSNVNNLCNKYLNHIWWEQAAIIELIESNAYDINKYIEYIPQNILNAYDNNYTQTNNDGYVNENSFILHLPSINNVKRYEIIKKYIERYYGP